MAIRWTSKKKFDALADLFAPEIRNAFLEAIQNVVDNAIIEDMIRAIEAGDLDAAFKAVGYSDAAMRPITQMLERAYERGGIMTGYTFPKYLNTPTGRAVFRFDIRSSRAEAYLRDQSSTLITRIGNETRDNIRNTLQSGLADGRNPRNVALDIVGRIDYASGKRTGGVIGLTPNQSQWVTGLRNDLQEINRSIRENIEGAAKSNYFQRELRDKRFDRTVLNAVRDGKPLTDDTIEKLVTNYKNNALQYRGETIGRTEALHSLNASEHEAIKQAVDMGAVKQSAVKRIWDSAGLDGRTRPSHIAMDGQTVGLDEPFTSPDGFQLMFPGDTSLGADAGETINCRCRARTEIDFFDGVK